MSIAFIFPGQGSQSVGMQNDLADGYAIVRETYDQASSVLGYDLWELVTDIHSTLPLQPSTVSAG